LLVNTGLDLLPTLFDFAGLPTPAKLTGRSLRPAALGEKPTTWRPYLVVENHMAQAGLVGDLKPVAQGRMVRSERYKYCLYDTGIRRESLVDLEKDPLETKDLAADPAYRPVLLEHRDLLRKFAAETKDTLAGEMLADDVGPRPFMAGEPKNRAARQG
jgi:arylsulfatase A-like enzyme